MILECGHCGAPLDVQEGATTTICKYCKTTNERQRMRTIAAQTPRDFRPPKQWVPPPHVAADSNTPLNYQSGKGSAAPGIAVLAVFLVMIGGGVAAQIFTKARGGGGGGILASGAKPAALANLNLAQSPAKVGQALSANGSETSVYAPLADPRYEYITFSWDEKHLDHPTSFYLAVRKGAADPKVAETISSKLRGGLKDNHWHWFGGAGVNIDKTTGSIGANVQLEVGHDHTPNPRWKEKLGALYKIVLNAAFGFPYTLAPRDAQELIGAGHPFAELAKIDPNTPVDNAAATIIAKFPGSVASPFISLDIDISIEHPLFYEASLAWKNEKNGTMTSARFSGINNFLQRRDALIACLQGTFGKPEVNDTDYVKKKKDFRFRFGKANVWINDDSMHLSSFGSSVEPADWTKFVTAAAACR